MKAPDLSLTPLINYSNTDFKHIYFFFYNWAKYNIKLNNCSARTMQWSQTFHLSNFFWKFNLDPRIRILNKNSEATSGLIKRVRKFCRGGSKKTRSYRKLISSRDSCYWIYLLNKRRKNYLNCENTSRPSI